MKEGGRHMQPQLAFIPTDRILVRHRELIGCGGLYSVAQPCPRRQPSQPPSQRICGTETLARTVRLIVYLRSWAVEEVDSRSDHPLYLSYLAECGLASS